MHAKLADFELARLLSVAGVRARQGRHAGVRGAGGQPSAVLGHFHASLSVSFVILRTTQTGGSISPLNRTKLAQGSPKSWAKFRPLAEIVCQKTGPRRAIRANPVNPTFPSSACTVRPTLREISTSCMTLTRPDPAPEFHVECRLAARRWTSSPSVDARGGLHRHGPGPPGAVKRPSRFPHYGHLTAVKCPFPPRPYKSTIQQRFSCTARFDGFRPGQKAQGGAGALPLAPGTAFVDGPQSNTRFAR